MPATCGSPSNAKSGAAQEGATNLAVGKAMTLLTVGLAAMLGERPRWVKMSHLP